MYEIPGMPEIGGVVVDASRMARATLISQIREQYNFREEVNGESGWQALVIDHSIQLVICALSMPMLDGDGLLARVRSSRLARLRQMPVLMIAGDNEEANERARVLGASDFISRGIGATELLARIASLLQLAQAQNELRESPERDAQHPGTGLPTRTEQGDLEIAKAAQPRSPVEVFVGRVESLAGVSARRGAIVRQQFGSRRCLGQHGALRRVVRDEDADDAVVANEVAGCGGIDPFGRHLLELIAGVEEEPPVTKRDVFGQHHRERLGIRERAFV